MCRKVILFTFLLLSFSAVFAQVYIQKNMVLLEITTGTWCVYCPGAAMAANQMVEEGLKVAVIENHGGDSFETSGSSYRNNFYNVGAYPTGKFNGYVEHVGGSTTSIYPEYFSIYDKSVNEETHYSLSLSVANLGGDNYSATILSNNLSKVEEDSIHLFVILTESQIEYSWMGQNKLDFVNRLMINGSEGLNICYSCSGTFYQSFNFSLKSGWNVENMEVVAFLQDIETKEVMQTCKANLPTILTQNDVVYNGDIQIEVDDCVNELTPIISIVNRGQEVLQNLEIESIVNKMDTNVFYWTGSLNYLDSLTIELTPILYKALNGENKYTVSLKKPNGVEDEIPEDNVIDTIFSQFWLTNRFLEVEIATDYYGNESSWELFNVNGEIVMNGDNYESGQEYRSFIEMQNKACYSFVCYDEAGNGIGQEGYIRLLDYYTQNIVYEVPLFTNEFAFNFGTDFLFKRSIGINNKYGNPIVYGDTVSIEAFANDTAIYEKFILENTTPLVNEFKISQEIISGNDSVETYFLINNRESYLNFDSVIIEGAGEYDKFTAVYKPNGSLESTLVKYMVWTVNDTSDCFVWYIKIKPKQTPPFSLQLLDSNFTYIQSGDTIEFVDYFMNMQSVKIPVYLENNSLIPIRVNVKSALLLQNEGHSITYDWGDSKGAQVGELSEPIDINIGDTAFSFSSIFSANSIHASALVRYDFYNMQNRNELVSVNVLYRSLENPFFDLSVLHDNKTINNNDTIRYNIVTTDKKRLITDFKLENNGNYNIDLQLDRTVLEGLGQFVDTTFWVDRFYLGANQTFPNSLLLQTGESENACRLCFDPPFKVNEFLISLSFFEKENEENSKTVYVAYSIKEDIGSSHELSENSIGIFPNPVNDLLQVFYSNESKISLSIYNLLGELVFEQENSMNMNMRVFDVTALKKGLYIVNVKTELGVKSLRFIKQ